MRKHTLLPFMVILALVTAVAAAVIGERRNAELTQYAVSVDRRSMPDGTVIEILSSDNDRMSLRKFSANGEVSGYWRLPDAVHSEMFSAYHVVGLIGAELYLYHYETPGDTAERYNEMIIAYNVDDGSRRIVADVPPADMDSYSIFRAVDIPGNNIFLGYLGANGKLDVWRMDAESGAVSKTYSVNTPFPLSAVSVASDGKLYALTSDSYIYRLEDGQWRQVFRGAPGEPVAGMMTGSDGAVYIFLVSSAEPRVGVLTPEEGYFRPFELDASGFIKLYIADDETWVALNEEYRHVVSIDGERQTIDSLTAPFALIWNNESLILLAVVFVVTAAVLMTARHILIKRKLSLLVKLIAATALIFTLGMFFIVSNAADFVSYTTEKAIRESLLEYADDTVSSIDGRSFAGIDWGNPYGDEYYTELLRAMSELSKDRLLKMSGPHSDEEHIAYTSYWLYRVEGAKVYTAVCDNFVIGLEMAYFENNAVNYARDKMIANRTATYSDIDGIESEMRWLAVLHPILDGEEVVGYLEVSRPRVTIDTAVSGVREQITRAGLFILIVVLAIIIFVLALSTRTLGKLKRSALAVSGGDYTARVNSRSWDETGEISAAFDKMAESVESAIRDITEVSCGYSRFVPDKLLELLGKASIKDIKPGDNITLKTTQILLFTDSFDTIKDRLFSELGRFYDTVAPCIAAGGGFMSGHSARGFAALFEAPPETALTCVMAMYSALDRIGNTADCHVFMNHSGVVLGVTGKDAHLNMIAVSRLAYESHSVGLIGKRFGVRLIVAESAFNAMGAARHRHRFLGVLRAGGESHMLYDFFDCDRPEVRLKKDMSKQQFERGVNLYYAKEYAMARRIFVDIIKEFPEDAASREYLRRSHAGQESGCEPLPLLELV